MKPHYGRIKDWCAVKSPEAHSLGYYIIGIWMDHPSFAGKLGHTSDVVARDGNEIETRNSRYTLEGPGK